MPAGYAHYRFGKLLLPVLPAHVRQTIQRFRRMYDAGLQGPDFFFCYNIFLKTPTGALGSTFHHQTGQEFFPVACKGATTEAAKAYLYGLLGHYCLDSICHPFVNQLVKIGEARHIPLESEFERFLLVLDKEPSPHTFDPGKYLKLTRGEANTVAAFYPGTDGGKVAAGIRNKALISEFLSHQRWQRLMPLVRKAAPTLWDHKIPENESEAMAPYVRELYSLYGQALEVYPEMLDQLIRHLETGEAFGEDFVRDFG